MISSHHKVRFELVVPTNDGILVLSLLQRFVLTQDTPSSHLGMSSDYIGSWSQTTATPSHPGSLVIMIVSGGCHHHQDDKVFWFAITISPVSLCSGLSPGLSCLGAAGEGAVKKLSSWGRGSVRGDSFHRENEIKKAYKRYLKLIERPFNLVLCLNRMSKKFLFNSLHEKIFSLSQTAYLLEGTFENLKSFVSIKPNEYSCH